MPKRIASRFLHRGHFFVVFAIVPLAQSALYADWINEPTGVVSANNSPIDYTGTGVNYGYMHATNGGTLNIGDNWVNESTGIITADTASTLNFNGTYVNQGVVNVEDTSTLNLGGTVNLATLGTVNAAATSSINIAGTLDNSFPISAPVYAGNWYLNGGTILGGSITSSSETQTLSNGQTFAIASGTFDGVTVTSGGINLAGAQLTVADGLTMEAGGLMIGATAVLNLNGPQTVSLAGGIFNFGFLQTSNGTSTVTGFNLGNYGNITANAGSSLVANFNVFNNNSSSTSIVANGGTITFPSLLDSANHGSVQAVNGGTINITASTAASLTNANLFDADLNSAININIPSGKFTNSGTIRTDGGTVSLNITANGSFADSGTIQLNGGRINDNETLVVSAGTLEGSGTINANVTLANLVLGEVAIASISNDSANSLSPTLLFELGGATRETGYNSLTINGAMQLHGNLEIQFANSFQTSITPSDTFIVLTADSLAGSFDNVAYGGRLETSDDDGSFQVNYGTGDDADEIVLSNFQPGVPEPASACLVAAGLLLICRRSRQRA